MRKLLISSIIAATCVLGATSFAADYYYSSADSHQIETDSIATLSSYSTVLIYKNVDGETTPSSSSIYYVNQADSTGWTDALTCLMKSGAAAGTYTVKMGGNESASASSYTFEVVDNAELQNIGEDTVLVADDSSFNYSNSEDANNTYKRVAFTSNGVDLTKYKYFNINADGQIYRIEIASLGLNEIPETDAAIAFAVQINHIPSNFETISAYLSADKQQ